MKAARHNSKSDILKMLLNYGAKPDIADEKGNTPLHFVAQRGTQELASFLINLGANPYVCNLDGYVPYEVCTNDQVRPHFCVCPVCKKIGTIAC